MVYSVLSWLPHFRTDKFPWLFPDYYSNFFPFSSILSAYFLNEFNKYKNLFNKGNSTKESEKKINKNKSWLKFPHFSSVLGKFPSFFPVFWVKFPYFSSLFKIPWIFPDWKKFSHFSRFSSPCGNHDFLLGKPTLSGERREIKEPGPIKCACWDDPLNKSRFSRDVQ